MYCHSFIIIWTLVDLNTRCPRYHFAKIVKHLSLIVFTCIQFFYVQLLVTLKVLTTNWTISVVPFHVLQLIVN